jgi:ABC-type oligopeptide transport system substrate-binding subunit
VEPSELVERAEEKGLRLEAVAEGGPGNGCHIHFSLWDGAGRNRFHDRSRPDRRPGFRPLDYERDEWFNRPMRLLLSLIATAVGAALLAFGALANPGARRAESVLNINVSSSGIPYLDPALDYEFIGWQLEFATCAKLVRYPDKAGVAGTVLQPEVAAAMPTVSRDGRTYTFRVRPGFAFNTGEKVTAATFAHVLERDLDPKMASPASIFAGDIVGAQAKLKGKAKTISGVKASGNTLTIRLTQNAPDFVARLAMNFFCAVPLDTPVDPKGVKTVAGAGPYYISESQPNRTVVIEKNPNYHGPRPHHVDRMVFTLNTDIRQSYLEVRAGQADYDAYGLPSTAPTELARQYGVNEGRFFVHPTNAINYLALNTSRPAFADVNVRKAVNYAIDRPAMARQAGYLAGTTSDQILPPGIRGFRNAHIYPLNGPDLAKAKALMGGKKIKAVMYTPNDPISIDQGQVVKANLAKIGISVQVKPYPFSVLTQAIGPKNAAFDIVQIGWIADYPDPVDFIDILLSGDRITEQNNNNLAHFNDPVFNRRIKTAELLSGPRRYAAFGAIDVDMMRKAAPWAPTYVPNIREFVSKRVGCYLFNPALAAMDLANVCLK